jgi:molybdate transport system substrate-binding protein
VESRATRNVCRAGLAACSEPPNLRPLPRGLAAVVLAVAVLLLGSCGLEKTAGENGAAGPKEEIVVAAAANLTDAFREIGTAFTAETGLAVIYNFGATAQLAQQIENGAPFDLFAAADVAHVDQLVADGKIVAASRAIYARGRLVLWIPPESKAAIRTLNDLLSPAVRFIAIANPDTAPYGSAAVETLQKENLWKGVKPKVVLAENVNVARQMASTGNADAAFTAFSLVMKDPGRIVAIDESLHAPIDQALGIVAASPNKANAQRFADFVLRGGGAAILQRSGYDLPPTHQLFR